MKLIRRLIEKVRKPKVIVITDHDEWLRFLDDALNGKR